MYTNEKLLLLFIFLLKHKKEGSRNMKLLGWMHTVGNPSGLCPSVPQEDLIKQCLYPLFQCRSQGWRQALLALSAWLLSFSLWYFDVPWVMQQTRVNLTYIRLCWLCMFYCINSSNWNDTILRSLLKNDLFSHLPSVPMRILASVSDPLHCIALLLYGEVQRKA